MILANQTGNQITIKTCIQILKQNHTYTINHRKYIIKSRKGQEKGGVKEGKSRYLLVQNRDPTIIFSVTKTQGDAGIS